MDPRLKPYYLSKWTCPTHGHFIARTANPVDPARPIPCPECVTVFEDQLKGMTVQPVPYVSRPRWPAKKEGFDVTVSDKAPLKKRKTRTW